MTCQNIGGRTRAFERLLSNWTFMKDAKPFLGSRVLVVTAQDAESQAVANRALFELQKIRKQAVFCTIPTRFPVANAIEDGTSLFLRAGCDSILTIGSGTVTDAGKMIRHLLSLRSRTSSKPTLSEMRPLNGPKIPLDIPLVCVPRSISPIHHASSFAWLINEEDAFLYRSSVPPDFVTSDTALLEQRPHAVVKGYLLASVFDCLFVEELSARCGYKIERADDDVVKQCMALTDVSDRVEYFKMAESIGTWRNKLSSQLLDPVNDIVRTEKFLANAEHWPGLIESATLVCGVHFSTVNPSEVYPYSHRMVKLLFSLTDVLKSTAEDELATSKSSRDTPILAALTARIRLASLLGLPNVEDFDNIIKEYRKVAADDVSKLTSSAASVSSAGRGQPIKSVEAVSAGSLAQGWIITEEAEIERRLKADGLIDDNSSSVKATTKKSLKLLMLSSEFFEQVIEKAM